MLNFPTLAPRLARNYSVMGQNKSLPRLAALCAAICLTLFACSQPPTPQSLAPAPAATQPAPAPLLPKPTPQPSSAPTQPAPLPTSAAIPSPPAQPTPSSTPTAAPAPPSVATPTPTAQPTPTPTPTPPPTLPPADVAFTQITASKTYACGLRENATALCWGHDNGDYGILAPPAQTAFRQISAGLHFACGLRQDATIACWGRNSAGQASPPQGSFSEIATGGNHACAIPLPQSSPPGLICWGAPFPNGDETLPLDAPISDIKAGGGSTCGLTPQADMACAQMSRRLTEITPGPFSGLDVGLHHICALREDGSAFCQEDNRQFRSSPPPTKFVQIAAGWNHSCGITRARRIECWGSGRPAAPGERLAAPDGEFVAITIAWRNSCALRPNGRAVCWGTPDYLPSDFAPEIPNISAGVSPAFGGAEFNLPVDIFPWPSGGLAVVEHKGVITAHRDQPDAPPPQTILDINHAVAAAAFSVPP